MRRTLFVLATLIVAALFVSPELQADIASRLCPSSAGGCLISDGTFLCLDSNRDGIPCSTGDPNLTINAPLGVTGDEQVQGDLDVAGDLHVVGTIPIKTVETRLMQFPQQGDLIGGLVIAVGFCMSSYSGGSVSIQCDTTNAIGSADIVLDQPVFLNEMRCGWSKGGTTWLTGDSVTFQLTEVTAAGTKTLKGTALTITDGSPGQDVSTITINENSTNSSNYAYMLQTTASNNPVEGAEGLRMTCMLRYSYL